MLNNFKAVMKKVGQWLKCRFMSIYEYLYSKRLKLKKTGIYSVFIVALATVAMFFYKDKDYKQLVIGALIVASIIALYILVLLIHFFIGKWLIYDAEIKYTKAWLETKFPKIVKIWGRTRVGKDSLATAVSYNLGKFLKEKTIKEMAHAKHILYFVNFIELEGFLNDKENAKRYFDPSEARIKALFLEDLKANRGFFKRIYLKKMDPLAIIAEMVEAKNDYSNLKSDYIYNDGTSAKHMYEILFSYVKNYVRLNYGINFIMANQPFIEDDNACLTAKIFSLRFLEINDGAIRVDKKQNKKYQELIWWAMVEKMVVYETETDTWYNNLDRQMISYIKEKGVNKTKAYNGHLFGEDCYWISVGQKAGRVMAILRDYDHSYIHVIQKELVEGGQKRNMLISPILNILNSIITSSEKSFMKFNDKLKVKKKYEVIRLRKLYLKTERQSYQKKITKIQQTEYKALSTFMESLAKLRTKLEQRIEQNKNDGYLRFSISISDSEREANMSEVSIKELADISKPLFKASYKTTLTFKIKDAHGRYRTHYLSALGEEKKQRTDFTFYDVPNWRADMLLHKKEVLFMGYPSSYEFFNFTADEINKFREKEIN